MYTGEDWPYEPLQEQKGSVKDGECFVLLLGERQDVDALREITTSYAYLMRYGRPFARLYNLVQRRPDRHLLFAIEEPFKHQQYTMHAHRLALLKAMLGQRNSMLYELVYWKDGERVVERNFEYVERGTLVDAAEQALRERGWEEHREPTAKRSRGLFDLYERAKIRQKKVKAEIYQFDRWWGMLSPIWRKFTKS